MSESGNLTAERFLRLKELLLAALELPPAERGRFVDGACGADEVLRREAMSLLAHGGHGKRLERIRRPPRVPIA